MTDYCRFNFIALCALAMICVLLIVFRIFPNQYSLLVGIGGGSGLSGLAFGIAYLFTSKS